MSKIEWTGKTWNPIVGCSRISAGCQHCYAERMTRRLAAMGQVKYQGLLDTNDRFNGVLRLNEVALEIPVRTKKPTVWFVNSMSDLFHSNVSIEWLAMIWHVMHQTPQHTYQILTKRAENMYAQVGTLAQVSGVLPNVWLGVSVENQAAADERIPWLLQAQAAVRFLSCEPLLGPVELWNTDEGVLRGVAVIESGGITQGTSDFPVEGYDDSYSGIEWVIAGGESGPDARPMHPDWVRSLRDQCVAARVSFFFKQWGEWLPNAQEYGCHQPAADYNRQHVLLGDVALARVGKKAAGRLLDGREWNEVPK